MGNIFPGTAQELSLVRALKQRPQSGFECAVLFRTPSFRSLCSAAGSAVFSGFVPGKQKRIDIVGRVLPSILVKHSGTSGQTHGCQSVILCDYKIPGNNAIHKGIVYTVCTLIKNKGLDTIPVKFVGRIAQQKAGEVLFSANPDCDIHHRTTVRINQYFQIVPSFVLLGVYHVFSTLQSI